MLCRLLAYHAYEIDAGASQLIYAAFNELPFTSKVYIHIHRHSFQHYILDYSEHHLQAPATSR